MGSHIAAQLDNWPTKDCMATILRAAGLRVEVGLYSVRLVDCSHFVFQEYGGDLGEPSIDADADTVEDMMRDVRLVSDALARVGLRHRVEIYDDSGRLVEYVHHEWPMQSSK